MTNLINKLSPKVSPRTATLASPAMDLVFRAGVGLLFTEHGAQKLFGFLGGVDGAGATVPLFSLFGLAGVFEFFGGLLIVVGLLTRPVAAILTAEMLSAFFMAHYPTGGFPIQNGGELALLYAIAFAFLASAGSGKWSVDRLLVRSTAYGQTLEGGNRTDRHRRHTERSAERRQPVRRNAEAPSTEGDAGLGKADGSF